MTTVLQTHDADRFSLSSRERSPRAHLSSDAMFWLALRASLSALNIRTADADQVERELRGVAAMRGSRTRDDVLTGNDPVPKTIGLGRIWTATAEELRDAATSPVAELQSGKNFVLAEVVEPEDVEDYVAANGKPPIDLGVTYQALAADSRARRARDAEAPRVSMGRQFGPHTQAAERDKNWEPGDGPRMAGINPGAEDDACDVPPHMKGTKDAARGGSSLFARARQHVQDYAAGLAPKRAAMAAQVAAAAAPGARCTAAEFAAARANKRAHAT
jgi:hypothetical protein